MGPAGANGSDALEANYIFMGPAGLVVLLDKLHLHGSCWDQWC